MSSARGRIWAFGIVIATVYVVTLVIGIASSVGFLSEPAARIDATSARLTTAVEPRDPDRRARIRKLEALDNTLAATVEAVVPPDRYWLDESLAAVAYTEKLIEAYDTAREALISEFGTAARAAHEFRRLFFPLGHRYAVLGSAQQIAVHAADLRLRASASTTGPEELHDAFGRHLKKLESEIGSAAAYEYALRASPLSEQIRSSGVELTEPEFRATYRSLATLNEAGVTPSLYHRVRRALRERLGSTRFAALWAPRDPRFEVLTRVGTRHGLDEHRVRSAYRVLLDIQDELLATALAQSSDSPDAARLRQLYDGSRKRLADIVGADVADAIMTALAVETAARTRRPMR